MPPEVFTGTPIEAYIVAIFMKGQMALAEIMKGTPVFRQVLFWALGFSMIISFARMAAHKHHAGTIFLHVVYRLVMVYVALFLTSRAYPNVQWSSMTSGTWGSKSGVNNDRRLAAVLGRDAMNPGLVGFVWIYGGLNNFATTLTNQVATAIGTPQAARDPMFLHKQLARMGSMALSPALRTQFDALVKDCSANAPPTIVGPYDGIREWLNMSDPSCATQYANFDAAARAEGRALVQNSFPASVIVNLQNELARRGWTPPGIDTLDHLGNIAMANALFKANRDREGRLEATGPLHFGGTTNQNANGAATFSGAGDRYVEETAKGFWGNLTFLNAADSISALWGGSATRAAQKGEAANRFNEMAPIIPAARGVVQGFLALLFVLAAYSVGFGTWKWMFAWITAQATLCLYKPVAALAYGVGNYFDQADKAAEAVRSMASSPLVLSGVSELHDQVPRIHTVIIMFELGVFFVFVLGAVKGFSTISHLTGQAAQSLGQTAAAAGQAVFAAVTGGGAAAAGSVTVNLGGALGGPGGAAGAASGAILTAAASSGGGGGGGGGGDDGGGGGGGDGGGGGGRMRWNPRGPRSPGGIIPQTSGGDDTWGEAA